jgi:polysaccharide export outer membrane protein
LSAGSITKRRYPGNRSRSDSRHSYAAAIDRAAIQPGKTALQSASVMRLGSRHHLMTLAAKVRAAIGFVLLCVVLAGCGGNGDLGRVSPAQEKAIAAAATESPRLQGGEKIRITVFGEASLSGEYQIDPSGYVSLPLAGTVKAAGFTQGELEDQLAKQLSNGGYLKNPKVTVSIVEFRPFYILGEVEKPGAYPYVGGLNALSAIAIAGGTTYRASRSEILIQHPGEDGLHRYDIDTSVPVLPGDIIKIPARYF